MRLAALVARIVWVGVTLALSGRGSLGAQGPQPLWANDLVPKQPPARNAVPSKDDPPLPTDNGSEHPIQADLRALARIADDQTYQDTGDPVVPTIGMVSHRATDLFIEGRGLNFSFERRYSSKYSDTDGPLGFGWDHCYNARLEISGAGAQVALHNGNHRQDVYAWSSQSSPIYNSPPGVYTLFKYEAPSTHILRNREGTRTYFENSLLKKIQDPEGNAITFYYNANGHLDYVIDTMGRLIDFSHDAQGRLEWIQDFRGRKVEYYYDPQGNLSGVRSPTVTSTATSDFPAGFNDFPTGRTERYTYLSGYGNLLDHKLTGIIRPNDVTQPTTPYGNPAVQFSYDTAPASVFFGWCTSQTLGGTNTAGTAGGTISYIYSVQDYTTPVTSNALNVGRLKTRVENRKGFATEYVVNQNGHVIQVTDLNDATPLTTTNEYNADGELVKITQPRGNYTTTAYSTGFRLVAGSVASITHNVGTVEIESDQASRTMTLEYEPVFNNLRLSTDYRGNVSETITDYQEGRAAQGEANDVIPAIQSEFLGICPRPFVESLVASFLYEEDLNGDGQQAIVKGNVVQERHPVTLINGLGGAPLALREGDQSQEALFTWTYNGYGQVTSETDEEENVTVYLYYPETDPDGNGVLTSPGTGLNAVTGGYLRRSVEDTALPFADPQLAGVAPRNQDSDIGRNSATNPALVSKITEYLYDPSGNVVAITDPRGVKYEYAVNELDEKWQERRATDTSASATRAGGLGGSSEDLTGQAFSYRELWRYDSNGNVTAHFTQNSGGWPDAVAVAGAPSSHFEEYWTYDILNKKRSEKKEHGFGGQTATWTFGYDPNENLSSIAFPEGNGEVYTWDFRDQMSSRTRGSGLEASQTRFYYDGNGNLRQTTDGRGKHTIIDYEGFDRVKRVVQPGGTEKKLTYDPDSNVVAMSMWGRPGGPSPVGNDTSQNIELQRSTHAYDQRSRLTQIDRQDPQAALTDGTLTPGDGKVTTVFNHDRLSRTVYIIDDDTSKSERLFDGAGRLIKETDPVGNVAEIGHDDNDNVVEVTERDIYPNATFRGFETFRVLDALNRVISSTDDIGHTERFLYDSRDHVVQRSDAVASLSPNYINGRQVNNPGNTTTFQVDGLGRVLFEESDLRVGGSGDGGLDSPTYNPDGRSRRTFTYDGNSLVRVATDDNGNPTEYEYDTLDRLKTIIYADDTQFTQAFDGNDNVLSWTDAVGSQCYNTYDDRNRLIAANATTTPASVVGTTALRYEHDGLDRLTKSRDSVDNVLEDSNDWVNEYTWDALNRAKTQKQNNRTVTSAWREEAKRTSVGYTSGITVQYTYDALERATVVTNATYGVQLAAYWYAGKDRLLQRSDYGGVVQRLHDGAWNDATYYDGARRPIKLEFKKGSALLTGIEHGFDRAHNRLHTRRLHDSSKGDNFVYDSMYRLVSWERNVPAVSVGYPGGANFQARHGFELDGAHSRHRTTKAVNGSQLSVPTVITVDDVHNYDTKKKGIGPQYTTWNQAFDLNGNKTAFTDQGTHPTYKYDCWDRLRVIEQGSQKVEFDYDAEGRRVRTKVTGLTGYPSTTEFVHDGEHVIEELDGGGACLRRFYYGDDLDELVGYENLAFYPGQGAYFYEQDSAGNVIAIHDGFGNVVERYNYGAFGSPFFETPLNAVKSVVQSDFGNPYLFQGLRYEDYYDALYYVRARFLDCTDGSFMQRDPLGVWGDYFNLGNLKAYCGGNPANWHDPLGLATEDPWWMPLAEAFCEGGAFITGAGDAMFLGIPSGVSQGVNGAASYNAAASQYATAMALGDAAGTVAGFYTGGGAVRVTAGAAAKAGGYGARRAARQAERIAREARRGSKLLGDKKPKEDKPKPPRVPKRPKKPRHGHGPTGTGQNPDHKELNERPGAPEKGDGQRKPRIPRRPQDMPPKPKT
jgi:RHS repeat-associated protein